MMYVGLYARVCVCVCVCVSDRELVRDVIWVVVSIPHLSLTRGEGRQEDVGGGSDNVISFIEVFSILRDFEVVQNSSHFSKPFFPPQKKKKKDDRERERRFFSISSCPRCFGLMIMDSRKVADWVPTGSE